MKNAAVRMLDTLEGIKSNRGTFKQIKKNTVMMMLFIFSIHKTRITKKYTSVNYKMNSQVACKCIHKFVASDFLT